jgi:arylsulfatase A-like enzyme
MDFEVGRILDAMDALGVADNIAVLFHADHGWKLGEHGARFSTEIYTREWHWSRVSIPYLSTLLSIFFTL